MSALAELDTAPQTIEPVVNYIVNDGTEMFTYTGGPGSLDVRTGGTPDPHKVVMHNGRPHVGEFDLDVARLPLRAVTTPRCRTSSTKTKIKRVYYPEMEALIKAESGAKRVVVFDHTLRTADDAFREQHKIREVVRRVHNDYTEWSGPQRVRDILPDEADELLKRRFAIIQVWRPIRYPVETHPLAIADARSVSFDDFVISERRYPEPRSARPTRSPTIRSTSGTGSRARRATRRWCSRSMTRRRTAARAGPPTPPSTIRPRRRTRGRARASKSARWRFSEPLLSVAGSHGAVARRASDALWPRD